MGCSFPQHHTGGKPSLLPWLMLAAVAGSVWWVLVTYGHAILTVLAIAGAVLGAALVVRLGVGLVRFVLAPSAARRMYPKMIRARLRWAWLTRNLNLAYLDPHKRRRIRDIFVRVPGGEAKIGRGGRINYPKARFRVDEYGVVARVKTVPRTGRTEFDKASPHIADAWRCQRVQVSQAAPGRLIVRGLVNDPLVTAFGPESAPEGTYTGGLTVRPYLGRDEWGQHRHIQLGGVTGISVAGLPGYGKTSFVLSLLMQLAGSAAVQFNFIDLKGGGDYRDWRDRAWQFCGDDLRNAVTILEDTHVLMRQRLAAANSGGSRNAWDRGPTNRKPLIVTVIDECHGLYDLEAVKGDREQEGLVRAARALTGQLVRKGRSVLFLTILITQKQTSDAIPTAIRDNCRIGLSFAVKTRDAAVAGLGESIRDYPSYCPTGLRDPQYVGVATATLPSGADPFVRLRVPEVTEEAAAERARMTEAFRADPTLVPAVKSLTPASKLEEVTA